MTIVVVPYHQDERLADKRIPLPDNGEFLVLDPPLPDGDIWGRLAALDDIAADQIAAVVRTGKPTTVLSGDCLVSMAVLAGARRAGVDPGVVWFDAHGDLHTVESSTSGYLGGLSLRLLLGGNPDRLAAPLGVLPVTEERTLLVDARDLDPPEADFLRTSRVRHTAVSGLDAGALPEGPLILHVDLDVVDPAELTGVLFPAPGGPSAAQTVDAVRRVLATGRVTVLDIACPWHPARGPREQQDRTELLRALISQR